MCSVCVVAQLHVAANYIKILTVAQQCFYGKFMSLATMQITIAVFVKNYTPSNLHPFHMLHIKTAWTQKNVCLHMALFRCTIQLHRS